MLTLRSEERSPPPPQPASSTSAATQGSRRRMGLACHVMDPATLAQRFRRFGAEAVGADSPLYAASARGDRGVAGAARARGALRGGDADVVLAAIHDELLREPDDELAAYYPTVGGRRAPDAALAAGARALLRRARGGSSRTRSPPAVRRPTRPRAAPGCCRPSPRWRAGGRSRRSRSAPARGSTGCGTTTPMTTQEPPRGIRTRRCGSRASCAAAAVPPLDPPPVAWRAGIDLSPVDLRDPDDVRWLRACVWPDQRARHERFEAALAVARRARAGRRPPRRRARAAARA